MDTTQPPNPFEEFRRSVEQLPSKEAAKWREGYIQRFVDTSSDFYRANIGHLELHVDGWCYESYLWDCLATYKVIPFADIERCLLTQPRSVFTMWDIHSQDKIRVPNYWKFDKASVLALKSDLLFPNLRYLPDDIYIFDKELSWTLIITHEDAPTGRLCIECNSAPQNDIP